MKTLQENWIKKSQDLKDDKSPSLASPFPSLFPSPFIFYFCFVHFAYLSHAFPLSSSLDPHDYLTNIIIKNNILILLDSTVVSNYLSTPPLRVCVSFDSLVFQKDCSRSNLRSIFHVPRSYIHPIWLLDVEDNVLLLIIERILSNNWKDYCQSGIENTQLVQYYKT